MPVVVIKSQSFTRIMRVSVDGASYRVVHTTSPATVSGPCGIGIPAVDYWRVFGGRGEYAERECEQDKPTFKRVVAAVKSVMAP